MFGKLMVICVLSGSAIMFAQSGDNMKQDIMKQDSMKQDSMQQDNMSSDPKKN